MGMTNDRQNPGATRSAYCEDIPRIEGGMSVVAIKRETEAPAEPFDIEIVHLHGE